MGNDLRELRLNRQLPAKDMVAVVQEIYPKFDKTVLSKCEHGEEYGVTIKPDALDALLSKFTPEQQAACKRRKSDKHRLTCRISGRLENVDHEALQRHTKDDGYDTIQDWLTAVVRAYIKQKESPSI